MNTRQREKANRLLIDMTLEIDRLHLHLYGQSWAKRPGRSDVEEWSDSKRHIEATKMAKILGDMVRLRELRRYAEAAGLDEEGQN